MPSQLTEQHRRMQLALRGATLSELQRLWPTLDTTRLPDTYPGWAAAVARLVRDHHGISSALAARYLRAMRAAADVADTAEVVLADPPPVEQVATSLRVTTVVAAKASTRAGTALERVAVNAFVTSSGAATRLVLNGGRDTIRATVAADPAAQGWRRVTSSKGCAFCRMLAGRGAVYKANTAAFHSHDHCSCAAEPVYR